MFNIIVNGANIYDWSSNQGLPLKHKRDRFWKKYHPGRLLSNQLKSKPAVGVFFSSISTGNSIRVTKSNSPCQLHFLYLASVLSATSNL